MIIRFYQRFLSPYKGFRCAHNELHRTGSCSVKVYLIVRNSPFSRMGRDIGLQFRACKSAHKRLSSENKDEKDKELKDLIDPAKDVEGLSHYWSEMLYSNKRYVDEDTKKKAILPCTSLGTLKTLAYVDNLDERAGQTFAGKKITIFNRSDVVGLPLAYMLKNDGATVYSFDLQGGVVMDKNSKEVSITRAEALQQSDTIITGVPSRAFEKIRGEEIQENTTCINFSFVQNFEESAKEAAGVYVPRVGPMTIAMCVRNAIRLYENNRAVYELGGNVHPFAWDTYGTVVPLAA